MCGCAPRQAEVVDGCGLLPPAPARQLLLPEPRRRFRSNLITFTRLSFQIRPWPLRRPNFLRLYARHGCRLPIPPARVRGKGWRFRFLGSLPYASGCNARIFRQITGFAAGIPVETGNLGMIRAAISFDFSASLRGAKPRSNPGAGIPAANSGSPRPPRRPRDDGRGHLGSHERGKQCRCRTIPRS
jgi:hypothetical protein